MLLLAGALQNSPGHGTRKEETGGLQFRQNAFNQGKMSSVLGQDKQPAAANHDQLHSANDPSRRTVVKQDGERRSLGSRQRNRLCLAGVKSGEVVQACCIGWRVPVDPVRVLGFPCSRSPSPVRDQFAPYRRRHKKLVEDRSNEIEPSDPGKEDEGTAFANRRHCVRQTANTALRIRFLGLPLRVCAVPKECNAMP